MLYMLGWRHGAVQLFLIRLGIGIGKTSAERAVQSAAEKVPGMKQKHPLTGYKRKAAGADVSSVDALIERGEAVTSRPLEMQTFFPGRLSNPIP